MAMNDKTKPLMKQKFTKADNTTDKPKARSKEEAWRHSYSCKASSS